ncbi:hypothetical protein BCR44DRAFT_1177029 [Catenaria anguillulae PL171]|uniref:EF-hand domain-containing protein n=1 Tax=Catenaria anguillulae PL171 TaxID=765915 RepID=A0A1Y2I173_9FUNG|nr:hypothetical protein BCR44DRAFT_1177029 [Catenaria anguillulae PL171]
MLKSFQLWIARTVARSRSKPPKLSRAQLRDLSHATKIPESELRSLYKRFMKACPQYHPNARETAPAPDQSDLRFGQRLRIRTTRIKLPPPRLDRAALRLLYSKFFPFGDPRAFADRVFDVLDADRDGLVGFIEYATALSIASRQMSLLHASGSFLHSVYATQTEMDSLLETMS